MASSPEAKKVRIVPSSLEEIGPGLSESVVHRALQAGQDAARRTRPAHPRNYAGLTRSAEATAVLREGLEASGWTPYYKDGINGALNPEKSAMLMFVPGDRATGDPERKPKSKRRGPRGIDLVETNQLSLFPDLIPDGGDAFTTWYVLNYFCRADSAIQIEVSLPKSFDVDKRVFDWERRFGLSSLFLDPSDGSPPPGEIEFDAEPSEPIDVPVEPIDGAFEADTEPDES